ncbi:MAG: DUF3793 family protein [Desulfuromonas thiophila]|nr:DUF3793 family protein [Desulfuromonas thiophila]
MPSVSSALQCISAPSCPCPLALPTVASDGLPSCSPCLTSQFWRDVAQCYAREEDCLAAFVAVSGAEVLAGIKPANLVRIPDRSHRCGRNFYQLWRQHGLAAPLARELAACELPVDGSGVLVLFYSPQLLQRRLLSRGAQAFLRRCGYRQIRQLDTVLEQLVARCRCGFPHEIGLFLGYPLKDVAGFMAGKSASRQRMWKIFGPPRRSEALADAFFRARVAVLEQVRQGRLQPLMAVS